MSNDLDALKLAMLARALESRHNNFDEVENLPLGKAPTSFYAYHTALRGVTVHPLRDAFAYAYLLTESEDPAHHERASRIIQKSITAQDTNPDHEWYGIWPYFYEEPLEEMERPDWNWADFCTSEMLFILFKHPECLDSSLNDTIKESFLHATNAIRKRDVTGSYTNICALGSFVTLAAARYYEWEDLWAYAIDRLRRFAAYTDQTGSFNEYNSPTYAFVTMRSLANILTYVDEPEVQRLAGRLHERVWFSLAKHFHAPTRQMAGPHSRSYATPLNDNAKLALQIGTQGLLDYFTPDNVPGSAPFPERMVCPDQLLSHFKSLTEPTQTHECFIVSNNNIPFVQGTTYLHPDFTLGTVNQSDFWHQRRPFVAYWGNANSEQFIQMRGQKNNHDFTSANSATVQSGPCALTVMNFLTKAGDRHPSLNMIKEDQFEAEDMRLRLQISGVPNDPQIHINGQPAQIGDSFAINNRVTLDLGGVYLGVCYPTGQYGSANSFGEIVQDEEGLWVDNVIYSGDNQTWNWNTLGDAGAAAAVYFASASETSREAFDTAFAKQTIDAHIADGRIKASWESATDTLAITASAIPSDRKTHASDFRTLINGEEVPFTRISEDKVAD